MGLYYIEYKYCLYSLQNQDRTKQKRVCVCILRDNNKHFKNEYLFLYLPCFKQATIMQGCKKDPSLIGAVCGENKIHREGPVIIKQA